MKSFLYATIFSCFVIACKTRSESGSTPRAVDNEQSAVARVSCSYGTGSADLPICMEVVDAKFSTEEEASPKDKSACFKALTSNRCMESYMKNDKIEISMDTVIFTYVPKESTCSLSCPTIFDGSQFSTWQATVDCKAGKHCEGSHRGGLAKDGSICYNRLSKASNNEYPGPLAGVCKFRSCVLDCVVNHLKDDDQFTLWSSRGCLGDSRCEADMEAEGRKVKVGDGDFCYNKLSKAFSNLVPNSMFGECIPVTN